MNRSKVPRKAANMAFSILLMILLLSNSKLAAEAAQEGVNQCLRVIIPSLFPFFVAANLMLSSGTAELLSRLLGRAVRRLFRLPKQAATPLVLGFLGGYPIGAKTAVTLYEQGDLNEKQAEYMLGFCSNTGPAIFLGLIGGSLFPNAALPLLLYGIHMASAVLTGIFMRRAMPPLRSTDASISAPSGNFLTAVQQAASSTMKICGLVLFFSVFIPLVLHWVPLPETGAGEVLRVLLTGTLDLPSGIRALTALPEPATRFLLSCAFVNWSGLCIHMQTYSVVAPSGLSMGLYWRGKALQSALAVLLSLPPFFLLSGGVSRQLLQLCLPVAAICTGAIVCLRPQAAKKSSGNFSRSVVS